MSIYTEDVEKACGYLMERGVYVAELIRPNIFGDYSSREKFVATNAAGIEPVEIGNGADVYALAKRARWTPPADTEDRLARERAFVEALLTKVAGRPGEGERT